MSASMRSRLVLGVVIRVSVVSDHSYLELVAPYPFEFRRGSIGCDHVAMLAEQVVYAGMCCAAGRPLLRRARKLQTRDPGMTLIGPSIAEMFVSIWLYAYMLVWRYSYTCE